MADVDTSRECLSRILTESKGNNEATICKKCSEYEVQLKDALEETISIRMINELLQKELLVRPTPKSTWGVEPDSKGHDRQPFKSRPMDHTCKISYSKVATAGGK
jgi:hypothetical protein